MRKLSIICILITAMLTIFVSQGLAGETYFPGSVQIDQLRASSKYVTDFSNASQDISVQDVGVIFMDNSTIGGFTDGNKGQTLQVVAPYSANNCTLKNGNATDQDIYLTDGADEEINPPGGWNLVCNGTAWIEVD